MRRLFSVVALVLILVATLISSAFAIPVRPDLEFHDPEFHQEIDFNGDDDFVVYYDPDRGEFYVYEHKQDEGFQTIPQEKSAPFIVSLFGKAVLGTMLIVLVFRIIGTVLLFFALSIRSRMVAWLGAVCFLGTIVLLPSILALAAGVLSLVGASKISEQQDDLSPPEETKIGE